jgi:diguanylate cyclase (GGDEF)-like protein
LRCEICGELPGNSTCMPSVVGGEVIGSVLVQTPRVLDHDETEDLEVSVRNAGPVIANLRNLAIAELRAATDALTGLADHRAVQDTLNRMVAQAGRSKTELAGILFDLDHFKRINDIHGHAKGDEVLANVGQAVASTVRESDFIGRSAARSSSCCCRTHRATVASCWPRSSGTVIDAQIPDLDRRLSAGFGVAVLPGDAVTGELLLRAADRALYMAKENGRNRVETLSSGQRSREPAERR